MSKIGGWYARFGFGLIAVILVPAALPAHALTTTKKKTVAPVHTTKGQSQLTGGNGEFGVVYTLKDKWNFEVISVGYSVQPFPSQYNVSAKRTEKLFMVTFAVKNANQTQAYYNDQNLFYAFDQYGKSYSLTDSAKSNDPKAGIGTMLQPGQGMGQVGTNITCKLAFEIDGKSNIQKIIMHDPLASSNDSVFRYYMSTATDAEDGAKGDPKNVVQPLPKNVVDPVDPSGFTPLAICKGGKPGDGTVIPSGMFLYTVESFGDSPAGTVINANAPKAGNKFVQAVLTLTNPDPAEANSYYDANWNADSPVVIDTDGDPYQLANNTRNEKVSSDSATDDKIDGLASRKIRYVFEVPQNAKLATLQIGADGGVLWDVDISGS